MLRAFFVFVVVVPGLLGLGGCGSVSRPGVAQPSSPALAAASIPKAWDQWMTRCLSEKGWATASIAGDQLSITDVPEAQRTRFQQDADSCTAQYEAVYPPTPMTRELAGNLYDQELVTKACLEKLGIPVDPPSSKEAYVEAYMAHRPTDWYAYAHVSQAMAGTPGGTAEVEKKCPQPRLPK